MSAVAGPLAGWVLFTALIATLGGIAGRWLVVPRSALAEEARATATGVAARLCLLGAVLLPVALGLVFHRQLVDFRDPFVAWTEDAALLLNGTDWGRSWKMAAAGSGVLLVGAALAALGRAEGWLLSTPLAFALAAYPAFTGHASGGDVPRGLTIPADVLHVLGAGAWIGGLAFVLLADRRLPDALPRLVRAFSPVALSSVTAILFTGLVGAWIHVDGPTALVSTAYGRLLVAKVTLVAGVLAMGARNWKQLTPRLGAPEGDAALRRSAAVELAVAQVVLLVTAVLVHTSPLAH